MLDIETLKQDLDADQFAAVTAPIGNMLCIANAGSGKTRVLTYRIAYLISQGEPESSFLMLTFTVKAANEMMSRIQNLLGKTSLRITGGTFHSVANKFVKKFSKLLGYERKVTVIDATDASDLMGLARMYYCAYHDINLRDAPTKADIASAYSYCRNTGKNLRDYVLEKKKRSTRRSMAEILRDITIMEGIIAEYESRKRLANQMDFDDLLLNFDRLLDYPEVQDYVHRNLPNVFVDEYQDINVVQDSIIRKLNASVNRLTAVGDDAQCIYGFRGSEVKFIKDFKDAFPNASIFPIRNNYRSTDKIVDLALSVINEGPNSSHKEMIAMQTSKRFPYLSNFLTEYEQADYIVEQVKDAHSRGIPYDEMAILSRTKRLPRAIEVALTNAKIPVYMECGIPFYERAHIRPVISFFKLLNNRRSQPAFWSLIEMAEGIGPVNARAIFEKFEQRDFDFQMLLDAKIPKRSYASFPVIAKTIITGDKMLQKHSSSPVKLKLSLLQSLAKLFCDQWLNQWIESEFKRNEWKSRKADVKTLMNALKDYDDIDTFLEDIALMDDKTDVKSAEGKVKITTIHRAKGLEWDKVFIPFLNDQLLPLTSDLGTTQEEIEEERRLCYVAITRARKELEMSSVNYLNDRQTYRGDPSPFLEGDTRGKYQIR